MSVVVVVLFAYFVCCQELNCGRVKCYKTTLLLLLRLLLMPLSSSSSLWAPFQSHSFNLFAQLLQIHPTKQHSKNGGDQWKAAVCDCALCFERERGREKNAHIIVQLRPQSCIAAVVATTELTSGFFLFFCGHLFNLDAAAAVAHEPSTNSVERVAKEK